MKASEARLLDFLKKSPQFVIPIYQRTYSWTERECRQLWSDVIRAGRSELVRGHFVGSIVYVEQGLSQVTSHSPLLVIDGQQRLTTVTLLLAALAEALDKRPDGMREPVDGFSPRKLRHYYLINPEEAGERFHKLLLSRSDRASLTAIVDNAPLPPIPSLRVTENAALFRRWIVEQGDELTTLCRGLAKLVVVDIALNRDQDNPQLIFESMNSTGKELSQADLIRNFVLMGLEPNLQTRLYEQFWHPMEVEFGQEAYGEHFDGFIRHYLTVRTGDIPNLRAVYDAFKEYARTPEVAADGVEPLVADLRRSARHYCAMALGSEHHEDLKQAFHDVRELKVDVAFPFLLELYADYDDGRLDADDFVNVVRLVEAYVFRRAICNIPTNSLNKTFSTFGKALKKDRYLESVKAHFLTMPSYRRFPNDDEFARELKARDLYNFPRRTYLLRRLENHGRREPVSVNEYTIEHVMPQNANPRLEWKAMLGPEWERIHQTWLHTLGNLTLTGYNAEFGDRPFPEKRDHQSGGFRTSPLRLNEDLRTLDRWDEATIQQRAARLAAKALSVWPAPRLDAATINAYRPSGAATAYTLADHPHLRTGAMSELFEQFRRAVLGLDPCVTEEILKYYVAFKAETNFVDVVGKVDRLRLTLNVKFHEIDDPQGVSADVTNLGHWGNGDVEVYLTGAHQLPYVMGLVRQSLEKQLGNGGEG